MNGLLDLSVLKREFERGNYALVAMRGPCDHWMTAASFGMIGLYERGLAGLRDLDDPQVRFFAGVVLWLAGDEREAVKLLATIDTPHARNLVHLIVKPYITVILQTGWDESSYLYLYSAAESVGRFRLVRVGFPPAPISPSPDADVCSWYDADDPPDFYFSQMVEWHLIPPSIRRLPCPLFGQTGDYDLHIQAVYPILKEFDELVVTDHTEFHDVSRLFDGNVHTIPVSVSIPDRIPPLRGGARPIDFLISGTMLHPYHPDKARLVNLLIDTDRFRPVVFDGFLTDYFGMLAATKVTAGFVRHPGATPSRGLEALAMGCALVVQEESVLTLYAGEEEGIVTYGNDGSGIVESVARILDQWEIWERRAAVGASIARDRFSSGSVASHLLRFLTYRAASPSVRRPSRSAPAPRKRPIVYKGWRWPAEISERLLEYNEKKLSRQGHDPTVSELVDVLRDRLLYAVCPEPRRSEFPVPISGDLPALFQRYREASALYPRHLVLHFALIRGLLHFGNDCEVREGIARAEIALEKQPSYWILSPLDDVFPWDFKSQSFNYRRYFDLVTDFLAGGGDVTATLVSLIRASLSFYLAHHRDPIPHLERAVSLDPDFPFYRFRLAQALKERGSEGDRERVVAICSSLAHDSMLAEGAVDLVAEMVERGEISPTADVEWMLRKRRRLMRSLYVQHRSEQWLHSPFPATRSDGRMKKPARILFLYREGVMWDEASLFDYRHSLALVEGLEQLGIDCFPIPLYEGVPFDSPGSWICHLKDFLDGERFDQVWVQLSLTRTDLPLCSYLQRLAPVRVGIVAESLGISAVTGSVQVDRNAGRFLTSTLPLLTHLLTVDGNDAAILDRSGIIRALWVPDAVPAWSVVEQMSTPDSSAPLCYDRFNPWVNAFGPETPFRITRFRDEVIKEAFDSLHYSLMEKMHRFSPGVDDLLSHHAQVREIRREAFSLKLREMERTPVYVNFPSPTHALSGGGIVRFEAMGRQYRYRERHGGHALLAMARGRPVLSWDMAGLHPALFRDGEEILLYPSGEPERIGSLFHRIASRPSEGERIARAALERIRNHHTVERRLRQILTWLESGTTSEYVLSDSSFAPISSEESTSPVKEPFGVTLTDTVNSILERFSHKIAVGDHEGGKRIVQEEFPCLFPLVPILATISLASNNHLDALVKAISYLGEFEGSATLLTIVALAHERISGGKVSPYRREAVRSNPVAEDLLKLLETPDHGCDSGGA